MKILIVDDEQPARERLALLVQELADHQICGCAGNGTEALTIAQAEQPDVVLMDIMMPQMDGLEAAQYLAKLETPPAVIFVTAYDEHALAAFAAHAADYLLKPIRQQHLQQALAKVTHLNRAQLAGLNQDLESQFSSAQRSHFCIKLGARLELISVAQVVYFQADQKYVTLRHEQGEAIIEEPLKALEQELEQQFLRIHRNALVAKQHIAGLEKNTAERYQIMFNTIADRLEVSRRHVAAVKRFLHDR